jgi:hypothetical protein
MESFKAQCIALRKRDHTLNEIVAITGRSKSSVYTHIHKIPLSAQKRAAISENSRQRALQVATARRGIARRPHKPFTQWTPELVLLVGHLMFDGELKKSCVYNNRSRALILRVRRLMRSVYDFAPHTHIDSQSGVQRISYHNVALAAFLKDKAEELMNTITLMPREHQREFIRAFFDDEGCMDFRVSNNLRRIRGYQNDEKVLILIRDLLKNFAITSKLRKPNEVVISGKENLMTFQKGINFSKGVRLNPNRTNSLWKKDIEKRKLLDMAIKSFKT